MLPLISLTSRLKSFTSSSISKSKYFFSNDNFYLFYVIPTIIPNACNDAFTTY